MLHKVENTYESGKEDLWGFPGSCDDFLNSILDASTEGIWVTDKDKNTSFVNQKLSEMLGYQRSEIFGVSPFSFLEIEDRPILSEHLGNVINGNKDKFELKYTCKDGSVLWASVSAVPIRNGSSDPTAVLAMITDVTEKKEFERLSGLAERRSAELNALLELIPDAVYIGTLEGITLCNTAALNMLGAESLPDLQNRIGELGSKFNVRWPESKRLLHEDELQFARALKGERVVENVIATNAQTGEEVHIQAANAPIIFNGEIIGAVAINTDITSRVRNAARLQESEERFRTLADNISQFTWMADAGGSVFWYNKRWYDYTGITIDEMNDQGWRKVHHPDHMERVSEKFSASLVSGEMWEDTFPLRGKDGIFRWFLSRAVPVQDENGKIIGWFGTNTDITEQKLAEEKLHEALSLAEEGRNTLSALMEYIPMGITIAAVPDVKILMVSRYGQELLEKKDKEIAGIPAPEHPSKWGIYRADGVTPGTPDELPLSRATMKGEIVKNEEWFVTRKDGTLIPILCNAAPILDKNGKVYGGVIGWQDIGELKRIQREMQHRNEELTRFIYTVSHDLKSPLITIRMFISNLKEDIKNHNEKGQNDDIGFIENAAIKMEQLLSDLLELSRVGRKEQVKTEVTLETVVRSAIELVTGRIRERNVKTMISAPPVMLYGHSPRLIQLYQNLIDNAIKFMGDQPSPVIELGAYEDENKQVVLFVKDNGIGIDNKYHDKVFGLFEKLNPSSDGTGIGLALVKRVIEVHDGRIWYSSPGENKGTTFFFTIDKAKILNRDI